MDRILDSKIGVKALKENQLKNALPNMKLLFGKLDDVRKRAEGVSESEKNEVYSLHHNLKYDNIFSIIGERGTGKTSVLFSIYDKLGGDDKNNTGDIVVPMIIPEMMNEDDSLIGWILTAIEFVIDRMETQIKAFRSDFNSVEDNGFFKDCVFNKKNRLRNQYDDTLHEFMSTKTKWKNHGYSYSENIRIEQDRIENSYRLINELKKLWDVIIRTKKQLNKSMNIVDGDKIKEPLIYIFIDDADLVPRILKELMYFMPKYMSHPNIAVIVSMSQSLMKISLEHNLYGDIIGQPMNLFHYPVRTMRLDDFNDSITETNSIDYNKAVRVYKNISHLSDDILLKVFASSNRFYIKEYNTLNRKANFILKRDNKNEEETILLENFWHEFINGLYETTRTPKKSKITRMIKKIPAMYFSFLGCTAREISNVCIAMEDMLKNLQQVNRELFKKENEEELLIVYNAISEFMNVIIDSNPSFKFLIKRKPYLFMYSYNSWFLYVNYVELNNLFGHVDYVETNIKDKLKVFISAYAMLNFIEHIIYIISPGRKKTHGYREFFELLFDMCNCDHIIFKENNLYSTFLRLENFYDKDIIQKFNINEMVHQDAFLNSVFLDFGSLQVKEKSERYYYGKICEFVGLDRAWGKLFCRVLFKRFSGIWGFNSVSPDDIKLIANVVDDNVIKKHIDTTSKDLINIVINRIDYIQWAENIIEKSSDYFQKEIDGNYNENIKLWTRMVLRLKKKCIEIAENNGGIVRISEVQNQLDNIINNNNDIVISWIKRKTAFYDIENVYDYLKSQIYNYQNSNRSVYKVVVIKDTEEFNKIIDGMRGNSLQIEHMLNVVMEKNRESSANLNLWIDRTVMREREKIEGDVTIHDEHLIKRRIGELEKMRNSLIPPDEVVHLYNSLQRIIRTTSNHTQRYTYNGVHRLYELVELCDMAFYFDDKSFNDLIEYLMCIRAIAHIYDLYIATILTRTWNNDIMYKNMSYNKPFDKVYRHIAYGWNDLNNFMEVFRTAVTEEQQKVIDRLLTGDKNVL